MGGILLILKILEIFWSFCGFWEYFGHFLGFGGILVIFRFRGVFYNFLRFLGYFGHFLGLGVFWLIFFLGFESIAVIF